MKEVNKSRIYQGNNPIIVNYRNLLISNKKLLENCNRCTKDDLNKSCNYYRPVQDNKKEELVLEIIRLNDKYFNGELPNYNSN